MMYPIESEYQNEEELRETIDARIKFHNDYLNPDLVVSDETKKLSELKNEFLVKYELTSDGEKSYLVKGFTQIGMVDPFP